jgi:hypothetical protein
MVPPCGLDRLNLSVTIHISHDRHYYKNYFNKNQVFSAPYFLELGGVSKILCQQFQLIRTPQPKMTPIFAVDVFNRSLEQQVER